MAKLSSPRHGSLQFWPRKRAEKFLPEVNWSTIKSDPKSPGLLGFIAYKAAMATAMVKDLTDKSMTANKKIAVPVTILEVPNMKVFSVRFYHSERLIKEIVVSNDKELKKLVRVPKEMPKFEAPANFDDIKLIVYSLPKYTTIKKTPDLSEVAVSSDNKLEFVKSLIGKEITLKDFLRHQLLDVRGLTKGKGLEGAVPRFGITLKQHKTEKGVRRPGSLAPWHPARVTFRTPHAGQLGLFSRIHYNLKVVNSGSISIKDINKGTGFKHYGKLKTNYLMLKGSVQGPVKRQILITPSFRPTKIQAKTKYEFLELA